jgi:hypothetical protein
MKAKTIGDKASSFIANLLLSAAIAAVLYWHLCLSGSGIPYWKCLLFGSVYMIAMDFVPRFKAAFVTIFWGAVIVAALRQTLAF